MTINDYLMTFNDYLMTQSINVRQHTGYPLNQIQSLYLNLNLQSYLKLKN